MSERLCTTCRHGRQTRYGFRCFLRPEGIRRGALWEQWIKRPSDYWCDRWEAQDE